MCKGNCVADLSNILNMETPLLLWYFPWHMNITSHLKYSKFIKVDFNGFLKNKLVYF